MKIFLAALLRIVAVTAVVAFAVRSDSVRAQSATHIAAWSMSPSRYPALIDSLDDAMSPFELRRRSGNPVLDGLAGRSVLVAAYFNESGSTVALDLHDLKGAGQVEVRVYGERLTEPKVREKFLASVRSCIAPFGGMLAPR